MKTQWVQSARASCGYCSNVFILDSTVICWMNCLGGMFCQWLCVCAFSAETFSCFDLRMSVKVRCFCLCVFLLLMHCLFTSMNECTCMCVCVCFRWDLCVGMFSLLTYCCIQTVVCLCFRWHMFLVFFYLCGFLFAAKILLLYFCG